MAATMTVAQRELAQVILRNPLLESWECLRFVPGGHLDEIGSMTDEQLVACGVLDIFVESTKLAAADLARKYEAARS